MVALFFVLKMPAVLYICNNRKDTMQMATTFMACSMEKLPG
jgi:hypothetical protein